ncbi:MAG TPA: peptidoglycan DD-metalloendopeptidase family protein, partial [Anaerolineae bacterium]|nr:peptidoglycan DD-metalloendopeptidase family protein [Anaerolineae bacterium]
PTPTPTLTPTATNTPTPTATSTSTPTFTPEPPTPTFTPTATATPPITDTATLVAPITPSTTLTGMLGLTATVGLTNTGVITPADTPTPVPFVPRTVAVPADIPNYLEVADHFWFTRPFTEAYQSWGSYYYPYGTNAGGKYFWHFGVDIQSAHGQPIVAVGDGTVVHAGPDTTVQTQLGPWPDFYGQAVIIMHDQRWENQPVYTLYGHVSRVLVSVGQPVKAGQPIALVGGLGVAIGPHLHLEVRQGAGTYDDTRNPDLWVKPDPGYGVVAGRVVDYQNYLVPVQLVTLHRVDEPRRFWRQTFTYPDNVVNSDDKYVETFTFSDVPAGQYLLKTSFDGYQLTVPVTVSEGKTSFALLQQTQPPKLPPAPAPAPAVQALPTEQPPLESQPQ